MVRGLRFWSLLLLLVTSCSQSGGDPPDAQDGALDLDAGRDSTVDSAAADAQADSDGARHCPLGLPCSVETDCDRGPCLEENATFIGGESDPIVGHPDGTTRVPTTLWKDGYCLQRMASPPDAMGCDPDEPTACGDCGRCVGIVRDSPATACFRSCTATPDDNDLCRDGYRCDLALQVCLPGCTSDDGCRISRMDTNGDGTIDPDSGDQLVYDTDSDATCDRESWRCQHGGTDGAVAGDVCEKDSECMADGQCLTSAGSGWPGGYCTRVRCDLEGRECSGENSICQSRGLESPWCLAGCEVASGEWTEGDSASYLDVTSGCREGYTCRWAGSRADSSPNGGCVPGEFNAIETPNVGASCDDDTGCYSPFGLGACLNQGTWPSQGYCSVIDCGAPGMPSDLCGPNAQCVDADGTAGEMTWCLSNCGSADDCGDGFGCLDYDGVPDTPNVCFPGCLDDTDCATDERCEIPEGLTVGRCRD